MNTLSRLFCSVVFVLVSSGYSAAKWVPTNGPYCGGVVEFLYLHDGVLLAGIGAPFVSRPNLVPSKIFRSTDYGNNWTPVYVGETETYFTSILDTDGKLLVTSNEGIIESTDKGKSWIEPDTSMRKLRINRLSKISHSENTFLFMGTMNQGLFSSSDGGENWTRMDSTIRNIEALAACGGKLYAATGSGLVVSTDFGHNWQPDGLRYYFVSQLDCMSDSIIFAQTNSGLFYSTDDGNDWLVTNRVGPGTRQFMNLVTIEKRKIYVSTSVGLFVSGDLGRTWKSLNFARRDITIFRKEGNIMFVGTRSKGIYRSSDGGSTWIPVDDGLMKCGVFHLAVSGKYMYAGTKGFGIYVSSDGGEEWESSNLTGNVRYYPADYVTALEVSSSDVYARTWVGFFRSTDNGATWQYSAIGDRQGKGFAASLAVNKSVIFAGTQGGLLRSTDGGKMWAWSDSGLSLSSGYPELPGINRMRRSEKEIPAVPPPRASTGSQKQRIVQALTFESKQVFAGVTGGDIFVSTDDGSFWTELDSNLTDNDFNQLTFVGKYMFALTQGNGVFRSSDDGRSWVRINYGLIDTDAHVLVSSGKNLFIGGGWGVYYSSDNGSHWQLVNTGLIDSTIIGLTVYNGYLYAGTWDNGVWERNISDIVNSAKCDTRPRHQGVDVEGKRTN